MGRPTKYTEQIGETICRRLANGESLRSICREEEIPDFSTVKRWLLNTKSKQFEEFRAQYAQARKIQADLLFDECIDIADDGTNDWIDREVGKGRIERVVDHEHVSRSALRINTRKWWVGKVAPEKYGDNISEGPPEPLPKPELVPNDAAKTSKVGSEYNGGS